MLTGLVAEQEVMKIFSFKLNLLKKGQKLRKLQTLSNSFTTLNLECILFW